MQKKLIGLFAGLVVAVALLITSQAQAGEKISICHTTGSSSNPVLRLNVSVNALPAHLAHGDFLPNAYGACTEGDPVPE